MVDDGCNIKSHGVGSIVVQKRGFESLYGDGGPIIQVNHTVNFNYYVCEVIGSRKSVNCLAGVNCVYQPDSDEKSLGDIEAYWSAEECHEIDNKPSRSMPHCHSVLYVKREKRDLS
eukprot:3220231-Ditylum_brightwellii.AAC.1